MKRPTSYVTVDVLFHFFYDSFPAVQILLRHRKTFSKEEKHTTTTVMSATSNRDASFLTAGQNYGEDYGRSMINLE